MKDITVVTHHGDGTASCLATGQVPTHALGAVTTRRASHIVPASPWKRWWFRRLRRWGGDRGRVASWTRRWRGPWQVRLADAPDQVAFSDASRSSCIQWEIDHFNNAL